MHNSDIRATLIHEFTHMKSFHDIEAIDGLIFRIRAHISMTKADTQLEHIVIALSVVKEDYISGDFAKCARIAKPIFDMVKDKTNFEHLDIMIITSVLYHVPEYTLAIQLAKKFIDTLTNKYAHIKHKRTLFQIYMNITYRLLRAMYYEVKDRVTQQTEFNEITSLLNEYSELALAICEEFNLRDYKEVIRIRLALASADCEGITTGLKHLKNLGANDWLKTSRDEVNEYLTFFNDKLTTLLRNLRTGIRIQKCRLAINMTAAQLADGLDITQSQINAYETGERGMKRTRLVQTADILGTTVTYLSGEDKLPPKLIENATLHKLLQVARHATDDDQEFLLDFVTKYVKHQNSIRKANNSPAL